MTAAVFAVLTVGGLLSQSSGRHAVGPTNSPIASSPTPLAVVTPTLSPTPIAVVTPTLSPTPIAVVTPTPSPTPIAVVTPTPSPTTPAPTPNTTQLAAAYLEAATAVNESNGAASATWDKSAQKLVDAKHVAKERAAAGLAFIRAVEKIPWTGDFKALARKVLTPDNKQYVSYHSAMASKTWDDFKVNRSEAEAANMQASAASNELRVALGMPPVPLLGR